VKTDEIRSRYLKFFEKRGHTIVPPDSLVPHNDPTLLFTGAGMNQFKEQFLGLKPLGFTRAATCQKCLRTGDLDNVGVTRWHMTLFEMLGNFSFGDYFKHDACQWAWQFMLEEMKLDPKKLHVTVYTDDDETYGIWSREVGVAADHIWRFGEESNFWPESAPSKGPNGPCGPCTELLYDTGISTKENATPANDSSRFVEVWNLVLQQFDRQEGGKLVPLPSKNIDTGMGLERMAAIMQGVPTAQDIDLMLPIVKLAAELCGKSYTPRAPRDSTKQDQRLRRIGEHVRSISFCIADGALPDRSGRGYVVRKLINRAALDGRMLGLCEPFLYKMVDLVEQMMGRTYPEIGQRKSTIATVLQSEEQRFAAAVNEDSPGIRHFQEVMDREYPEDAAVKTADPGKLANIMFECYDTFGVPLEYMEAELLERNVACDRAEFEKVMEIRREESRAGSTMGKGAIVFKRETLSEGALDRLRRENVNTEFVGYEATESEATILAILVGDQWVNAVEAGQEAQVLLDRTPFYARSGGQVGDVGRLEADDLVAAAVSDTILDHEYIVHLVKVERGRLMRRQAVRAEVDPATRLATGRNHTATHLLQWALRKVLGEHVHQAGSEVSPERLRFDFTQPAGLSAEDRRRVEDLVNERILDGAEVDVRQMPQAEARKLGAMALFGEKYGDEVRVVTIGDYSMELCGGTHLDAVAKIGLFKITGEESVAAGVRRITAVTGTGALKYLHEEEDRMAEVAAALKATPDTLVARIEALKREIKELRGQLTQARSLTKRGGGMDEVMVKLQDVDGASVVVSQVEGADAESLREACDAARQKHKSILVVLASVEGEKINLVAAATKDLTERGIHAGNLIRELAKEVGGGGGGRPDLGQAGGKNPAALPGALAKVPEIVKKQLAAKK
jgi:alanyl-tRNA synthetase